MIYSVSSATSFFYESVLKPALFRVDPEKVHEGMLSLGEFLGTCYCTKTLISKFYAYSDTQLSQEVHGITFANPVGLAAGFDYQAKLTQILPSVGFGFMTVGTITKSPYGGNPKPRLGRLPLSQSLMVNKGFKNKGVGAIIKKLERKRFAFPVGMSVGRTNSTSLITQKDSVADIVATFTRFETSKMQHKYYELNISCPNLRGNISFYPPKNLRELLSQVTKLRLTKPLFIKMPIEKSDSEVRQMLDVIVNFPVTGIIFGNLQKNRQDAALDPQEVARFPVGNFSGKPTFIRSNELIKLAYKYYGKKLTIIGCGGIFSAKDAYTKIKLGATLVQMITGMVYKGPALIGQINYGLIKLLKTDGFTRISQAIGVANL